MRTKISLILLIFGIFSYANTFQTASDGNGIIMSEGGNNKWCPCCGMDLIKFFKTNTYIIQKDNTKKQFCSFHCLVSAEKNDIFKRDKLKGVFAVDVSSESFVPVEKLHFVVGSKVSGTMTNISKYPFASMEKALQFVRKNGGSIRDFEETYKLAKKHLAEEIERIKIKRERMMFPMGEKIYKKVCDKDALQMISYKNISNLKSEIKRRNLCGKLNEKQLQAIALFLAFKKNIKRNMNIFKVPENSKCPVCGMFVAKYPGWASMIVLGSGKKFYFDGSKDLFKFYFRSKFYLRSKTTPVFKKILIKDYYTGEMLDGRKLFYVIGSDVYGPMGNELVPHKSKESAMVFFKDHKGKKILHFNEINKNLVESLDN